MAQRGKSARAQVPLRIPEALRARIGEAAKDEGRSMNAEILKRLEQSFDFEDRLGGRGMVDMIEQVASAMKSAGEWAGEFAFATRPLSGSKYMWRSSPWAYDHAMRAAVGVLEYFRPPGEIVPPGPNPDIVEFVGDLDQAREELRDLARRTADDELTKEEKDDE
jgi:hypothetical protein